MVKASTSYCLSPSEYLETILGNKPVKATTDHSFLNRLNTEIELDCVVIKRQEGESLK